MTALFKVLARLNQSRRYLTLLLVAAIAAGLWTAFARARAERDDTLAMAERICAAANSDFVTDECTPGVACAQKVKLLAAFRNDAQAATTQHLIGALQEHADKQMRDAQRRAATREAQRAAAAAMIHAEEQIDENQVNGNWFAALNRLAGLRPKNN